MKSSEGQCEMCGRKLKHKEFYACTGWSAEDVILKARDREITMTTNEAITFLIDHSSKIADAMVEAGWEAIEYFIGSLQDEKGGE